jgi:His/Glu/Gln/Arg/opine family amino acid ABC transporter permease subunit
MRLDVITQNFRYMLGGFELTIILAIASMIGSIFSGTVLAVFRLSDIWLLRNFALLFINIFRSIPLLMFIFWFFFLIPIFVGHTAPPILIAAIALATYNTSYMAEVIRSGIQSVPKGQMEAARSSGLSYARAMGHIVLPQAFRYMLPAIISRFIALFMSTSLVFVIGVTEFFRAANNVNNRVFESYTIYGFVALVYFVCCFGLSMLARLFQRRGGVVEATF